MNRLRVIRLQVGPILALAALFCLILSPVSSVKADSLARGFQAEGNLQPGMVVALKDKKTVKAAPANDTRQIYGVVIQPSDVPFTVGDQGAKIFVATSGNYPVLVSSRYGTIKKGDYISMSTIDGIAAKDTSDRYAILGKALDGFDGKSRVITTIDGNAIGQIGVTIAPGRNPIIKSNALVPGPLKRISESVAGGEVSALKIYLALGVLIVSSAIAGVVVSQAVRSGIYSIGRNPLSKKSIYRGLTQSAIMAFLIFIIGLFGVYLLLRL